MQLDLYLQETKQLAEYNASILDDVKQRLQQGDILTRLEQSGVLHAFQVLIENAIGKAKHTLKHLDCTVPTSAYDTFKELVEQGVISQADLDQWNAIIGLRNKIVHDYMNLDVRIVLELVKNNQYAVVVRFLLQGFPRSSD